MKLYITTLIEGRTALLIRPQSERDYGIWDVPHAVQITRENVSGQTMEGLYNILKEIGIRPMINFISNNTVDDILCIKTDDCAISEFYRWLFPDCPEDLSFSMAVKAWLWDQRQYIEKSMIM